MTDTIKNNLQALVTAEKITQEEYDGLVCVPAPMLEKIYTSQFKDIYDAIEVDLMYAKKCKTCWTDEFKVEPCEATNDELKIELESLVTARIVTGTKNFTPPEGEKFKIHYVGFDVDTTNYIIGLIKKDKEAFENNWADEHKPNIKKNVKKSGEKTTREAFSGTLNYKADGEVGAKDNPEGADNPYYFKGDEEQMICKATFTAKDKSYKNMSYKSIKAKNYMGGDESLEDDDGCNGAVIWDRATGSNAISKTGISPAKFRIRCSNKSIKDGKCKGCMKNPNFFTDTYKITGKAKGQEHNGTTFKDFIVKNLEYA